MFQLRTLPFDAAKNAVASEQTCEYHYGKHHKTYVDNLNKLIDGGEYANASLYDIIKGASGGVFNNAAQIYNHDFYWDCIARASEPSEALKSALESIEDFKAKFIAAATTLFGSGWCWLVYDPATKALEIVQTSNAANPITQDKVPLLVVDVWEHAYYIDDKNARAKYLERFWDGINWAFVSQAYEWALKEGMGSVKFYIDELHGSDK